MLLKHKDTLKVIEIGSLSAGGRAHFFSACDFPKLEVLGLSRWQREKNLEFSPAEADALLGPSLKVFTWDFTIYDQHSESWTDFGEREEQWVRELAKAAIARKAALKKIKIIFNPEDWETKEEDGYPWDRMNKVRDEIQPHGLVLEYSEPRLSKEGWLEEVRLRQEPLDYTSSDPSVPDEVEGVAEVEEVADKLFEGKDIREYFFPARGR
jgi:hypothetical protein